MKIVSFEIRPVKTGKRFKIADATDVTLKLKLACGHTETRDVLGGLAKPPKHLVCGKCK